MPFHRLSGTSIARTIASYAPEAVIATLIAIPFMTEPAYAYVDPSVMTYAIQAFAGIAVALSAVAGVLLRRTRKKMFALLKIDENAHKDVEPDVHRVVDGRPVAVRPDTAASEAAELPSARRQAETPIASPGAHLRWRARFGYALLASSLLSFTLFVVAPFEIVAANTSSLMFRLEDVGWALALFAALVALGLAFALSALRGRGFSVALLATIGIAVACYVQALFLNQGLPAADGNTVMWGNYKTIAAISLAAWIAVLAFALFAGHRHAKRWRAIGSAFAVALIVVQGVGLASLFVAPLLGGGNPQRIDVTEDGLFDLAPQDNVVVFVLDTFDTANAEQIRANHPEALDPFENFTLFRNSTGSMIPTRYAIPFLLNEQVPEQGQTFEEFYDDRYGRSSFVSDIHDVGYSVGIYSDTFDMEFNLPSEQELASQTMNLHALQNNQVDVVGAVGILAKCALYRDMPWLIKPWFWYYTDEINNATAPANADPDASTPYRMNDPAYAEKLREKGLGVVEDGSEGAFRFIHLQGPHYPYTMDENALRVGMNESTVERQALGSLKIVSEYLEEMKRLGVYDSSTIIVTADHGIWYLTPEEISESTSPLMLVKPKTSPGERAPLAVSDMPVSHMDFHATVIDAVGGDSEKYGETVFEVDDPNRTRLYYMTTSNGKHDTGIKEIEIDGDALNFSTWRFTGNEWPIVPPED